MGCFQSRNMSQDSSQSGSDLSHNPPTSNPHSVNKPSFMAHDKIHINAGWGVVVTRFNVESPTMPFNYMLEEDANLKTFFELEKEEEEDVVLGDGVRRKSTWKFDAIDLRLRADVHWCYHQFVAHKTLRYLVKKLLTEHLDDAIDPLKRLGSLHAEYNISFTDLYKFEDAFMWTLKEYNPQLNPIAKDAWRRLIEFMLRAMAVGMTLHHEKMAYVMAPLDELQSGVCKKCVTRFKPVKPPAMLFDAVTSMKTLGQYLADSAD